MKRPRYENPRDFRKTLDARIRNLAEREGLPAARIRQIVVIDRFIARLAETFGPRLVVKGAMALEYRMPLARTTKDLDASASGTSPDELLDAIQEAGERDLGDRLRYKAQLHPHHSVVQGAGVTYGGLRFQVVPEIGGSPAGAPFGFDVSFGDPLVGEPEEVSGHDFLSFAGVLPGRFWIYPLATHLAEKLHAYTLPRTAPNTRLKDLPDLALLARLGPLQDDRLLEAFQRVFAFRDTHPVPARLPDPPAAWSGRYRALAEDAAFPWSDLDALVLAARAFLDPLLAGRPGRWDPTTWSWIPITVS